MIGGADRVATVSPHGIRADAHRSGFDAKMRFSRRTPWRSFATQSPSDGNGKDFNRDVQIVEA